MTAILILLGIGLVAGVLSGMIGIGGGIIIVPALVYFFGFTQHTAQGTSLIMFMLPIGFLGVYNYYNAGHINGETVKYALIVSSSFILGSFFGSKISIAIDEQLLKRFFGVIIFLISIKMILGK